MMSHASHAALFLVLSAMAVSGSARAEEVALPGGAASLRETHGDWSVTCAIQTRTDGGKAKLCAFSQEQLQGQTRQRVLAVELRPGNGGVKGTLVLPFGLALEQGAAYQLDEGKSGTRQNFRTCLPVGCLIDVDFDAGVVTSLKTGNVLRIRATADGGKEMNFSISLAGFASAYERTVTLLH